MIRIRLLSSTAAALMIGFAGSAVANVDVNDLCLGAEAGGEVSAASLDAGFRSIDTDGDGYLSAEEYDVCLTSTAAAKAGSKNAKERMAAFDTDGDNQISREEYEAAGGSLTGDAAGTAGEGAGASSQSVAAGTMSEPGDEDQAGAAGADTAQGATESGELSSESETAAVTTPATTSEPGDEDQAGTADATSADATSAEGAQGAGEMTSQGDSSLGEADSAVAAAPATPGDAELQQLASEVVGKTLVNSNGEELGEIEDVVIDDGGDAVYLIAAVGGFLGLGERDIAVPFQDVGMQDDAVVLMEPTTKEELEQMPPYEDGTYRSLKAE
jgi:sporulation protein YlmC with PRC-barrel domain